MTSIEPVLETLKKNGKKLTEVRRAVISIVFESERPLSVSDILNDLSKIDLTPNKTTVYRELAFLLAEGYIKEVVISPSVVYYESALLSHHHHLVCTKCGVIKEIDCPETEESFTQIAKSAQGKGFNIQTHNLEFFGRCVSCN